MQYEKIYRIAGRVPLLQTILYGDLEPHGKLPMDQILYVMDLIIELTYRACSSVIRILYYRPVTIFSSAGSSFLATSARKQEAK